MFCICCPAICGMFDGKFVKSSPMTRREDLSSKCKTLNRPEWVSQYIMSPNSSLKYKKLVSTWEIQFSSFAVFSVEDFTPNTTACRVTTVKNNLNFVLDYLILHCCSHVIRQFCKTPNVDTKCTCLKSLRKPGNCHIPRCYS